MKNVDGSYANSKYVHKNGQYEVIVDRNNNIVTLPSSTGTFNYYPATERILHMDYDVDPWMDFGSGNGDNTTYDSRKNNSYYYFLNIGSAFGEFIFSPNQGAIDKFNLIDYKKRNK